MTVHPLPVPTPVPAADRLAAIKNEIAELEREYAELRGRILSGQVSPVGEDWVAYVVERSSRRISVSDAERVLSAETMEMLTKTTTATYLSLVRKQTNKPPRKARKPRLWPRKKRE